LTNSKNDLLLLLSHRTEKGFFMSITGSLFSLSLSQGSMAAEETALFLLGGV